jgi:hypothetical protein
MEMNEKISGQVLNLCFVLFTLRYMLLHLQIKISAVAGKVRYKQKLKSASYYLKGMEALVRNRLLAQGKKFGLRPTLTSCAKNIVYV